MPFVINVSSRSAAAILPVKNRSRCHTPLAMFYGLCLVTLLLVTRSLFYIETRRITPRLPTNIEVTSSVLIRAKTEYLPYSRTLQTTFPHITVVTFASESFFDNVENLIGSLHVWATDVPIVVYDLQLSSKQVEELQNFRDVTVVPFDFTQYPPHVKNLFNYAFKPLLFLDAVRRFGSVLLLDSGIEVRGSLFYVFESVQTAGYFFVEGESKYDSMTRNTHPLTAQYLNFNLSMFKGRQMCYAGMHGYRNDSVAVTQVLKPTVDCALIPECIEPRSSGHDNHRYEQAVFSLFMRSIGLYCHPDAKFRESTPVLVTPNPLELSQPQTFFFRRWRYPKPYAAYVATLNSSVTRFSNTILAARKNTTLVESPYTWRKLSGDELVKCLQQNNNDQSKCAEALNRSHSEAWKKPQMGTADYAAIESFRGEFYDLVAQLVRAWRSWLRHFIIIWLLPVIYFLRPKHKLLRILRGILLAVVIVLSIRFYHSYLALPWRRSCSSDSEGGWAIGITITDSPFHVSEFAPVVTCSMPSDMIATFVADPFLLQGPREEPRTWYLFFEAKDAETRSLLWNGHGVISYAKSVDDGTTWHYGGIALRESFHVSYPFVFWHEGRPYMVPETNKVSAIRLYSTDSFPRRWHVVRELLWGEKFVDPTLFEYNRRWWLYTTTTSAQDCLDLYYSDSLFGPYVKHPKSPVVVKAPRHARPGGRPIIDNEGRLLRFGQDGSLGYGRAVYAVHVTTLTPTDYEETVLYDHPLLQGSHLNRAWNAHRMHHIDFHRLQNGKWIAVADGD